MLIYRDSQRSLSARQLRAGLSRAITGLEHPALQHDCGIEALLRAAELECALADASDTTTAEAAQLTDALAARWLGLPQPNAAQLQKWLANLSLPDMLTLSTPEGYAYYALSPSAYRDLARSVELPDSALVIGLRSIGTSLAAVVCETLRERGMLAQRTSVRPCAQPERQQLQFDEAQRATIERLRKTDTAFVLVGDGPCAGGSNLLALAEALEARGVAAKRIWLLGSQAPGAQATITPNPGRSGRFRRYIVDPGPGANLDIDLSAGTWREHMFCEPSQWPACWPQRERVKGLSADHRFFDKFEGLPPYRAEPLARARLLAQEGYAPVPCTLPDGFVRYQYLHGRPAHPKDLGERLLAELARYCAFRARAFPANAYDAKPLSHMLCTNVAEALSVELAVQPAFEIRSAAIADGRMQPHEWRITMQGRLYKTDGHAHGDDHLLPGPTDIAWDLAGAIVEWRMSRTIGERFVDCYDVLSGDRARRRLPAYVAAYCALRTAEMEHAARSCTGDETNRARAAQTYYRDKLAQVLREQGWLSASNRARTQRSQDRHSNAPSELRPSQAPPA